MCIRGSDLEVSQLAMEEETLRPPVKRKHFSSEESSSSIEDVLFLTTDSSRESGGLDSDLMCFSPSEDEEQTDDESVVSVDTAWPLPSTLAIQSGNSEDKHLKAVAQVLISECCSKLCVRDLTVNSLLFAQRKFMSMGSVAQRQWITD